MLIGMTLVGWLTKSPAIAIANTARTSQISTSTKHMNKMRARLLIVLAVISAIEWPFSRTLATSAPKSCAAPMKIVPKTTQASAGPQPQYAATQGPMIGAAPAIEVKWWPKSTARCVGTKSTPSLELVRRRDEVLLVFEDALAQKSRIESIRDNECAQDQSCDHGCHLSRWWAFFAFWSSTIPLSFGTKNAKVPA